MSRNVLDKVDEASRFNEKIKDLDNHEDWNRDNFGNALRMADTMLSQIEQSLLDLDNDIEREWDRLEKRIESYGSGKVDDLESTDIGQGDNPTHIAYKEHLMQILDLKDRVVEWKSAKEEIESICRENLKSISKGLAADYVSGETRNNVAEIADELSSQKVESEVQNARLELLERLNAFGRDIDYIVASLDGLRRSELPSSNVSINNNNDDSRMGSEGYGDGDVSNSSVDDDGVDYRLKGKDIAEKKKVVESLLGNENVDSQGAAAKLTDVTQPGLGKIVRNLEEEYDKDYRI